MIYGVDYYPEHDPEERWATDARLIAEAGFTTVRLAEFAWARIEPQAGVYNFTWLDRAIELLAGHGLQVVLGTPTAAPPQWLAAQHPEILYVDEQGRRAAPQSRRFVCLSNPVYRAASQQICLAMAERYGQHPAIIGWQIDNEFGCNNTARCFCASCQQAFCTWLEQRYGSLQALNQAWGTVFWGQEYSDWAQVALPRWTPTYHSPGHMLDSYRFASHITAEYQDLQIAILRDYAPNHLICHNYMSNFDQLDYAALSKPLDLVAWDNYIPDGVMWRDTARYSDMMRGYKHRPFWVVESPPGQVNWTRYNPDLRQGEARLRSLQAIAHGADGLFYFQWRAFRAGGEQYHSAILPHDGIPGRLFAEASVLGAELKRLRPLLANTEVHARVAILADMDSYWALQYQPQSAALHDPQIYVKPWYEALRKRSIAVEFCQPDEDLSGYAMVIAPSLHVLQPQAATNLRRYVETGGALIVGPRTGFKESTNQVTSSPLPGLLSELLGVRVAEWAALIPGDERTLEFGDSDFAGTATATDWRELLELRGATALVRYSGGFEAGQVAVATNRVGEGVAWYVGALGDDLIEQLLEIRLRSLAIDSWTVPGGVELCERSGEGRRLLFALNHTEDEQDVMLEGRWRDVLDNTTIEGVLRLGPLAVRVLVPTENLSETKLPLHKDTKI